VFELTFAFVLDGVLAFAFAFVLDGVLAFAFIFCAYIRICGDIYREKCESLLF
jgi:hypothetical protein